VTSSQATLLLFEAIQSQLKLHATANQIEAVSVILFENSKLTPSHLLHSIVISHIICLSNPIVIV
jgi:hypothetical protein